MTFPFPNTLMTSRVSGPDIVAQMATASGSYVSAHPSDYTGGMVTWSATQTFTNTPVSNGTAANVFRDGDTNDSLFTAKSQAENLGLISTSVLAWQSSRVTTAPLDFKINGNAATEVSSAQYSTSSTSDSGKVYYQSYRLYKAGAPLIADVTTTSVDFQTGGAVGQTNDKGGFAFLPGDWDYDTSGSAMSGSGNLIIPGKRVALLICCGNSDGFVNLFNFGTNANLSFLLNYNTRWYDNVQVAIIGNRTASSQSVSYSISADSINSPVPVFFKLSGD